MMDDLDKIPEWQAVCKAFNERKYPTATSLCLEGVEMPIGNVFALSVRDDEFPGSNLVKITNEDLLAKLRVFKGQFCTSAHPSMPPTIPIYWYEHLMSEGDYRHYSKTGKIPTPGPDHDWRACPECTRY